MSFSSEIKKFIEKTHDRTNSEFRKTALGIFAGIVKLTPVDTGRARGNWQVTLNKPAESELDTTQIQSPAAANKAVMGRDTIYITNNLPYIERLEHGHSGQAPNGMVKVTLAAFK